MKISCVIIDDEPLAIGLLESHVRKTPFLELKGTYPSAVAALQAFQDPDVEPVDLLFLDIQMPDLDGLEFSRMLSPATKVVFTTAFDQYAIEGFRVQALDYLLKPISYADFMSTANKVYQWFEERSAESESSVRTNKELDVIYVKSDYKLVQIPLSKILYIEGMKDYLKIYLQDQPKPILSLLSMKRMEEVLQSPRFLRVHRSFIVQMDR